RPIEMAEQDPIVYIVDDDPGVRNAMDNLIRSVGLKARTFVSADEFLRAKLPSAPGCLILDVRMPGRSGLDLQNELLKVDNPIPIIFISGHGDVPMAVRVMKAGALEFLIKPFRDQELLDAIQQGIEKDRLRRAEESIASDLNGRWLTLTPGERNVMELVVQGFLNKQIAGELNVSEITVKVRRGLVMRKM